MNNSAGKARKIALGGILGALVVVCILLATVLPTNKLSLYALGSVFISVIIVESGIKVGWIFYAATCLVSAIVVPEKLGLVPYVIFFGVYGIAKYYIEKLGRLTFEWGLKLIYFNVCVAVTALAVKELFGFALSAVYPLWILVIALEIAFIIYDVVYTLFINYYKNKLRPRL